jgi:hypothetical protein
MSCQMDPGVMTATSLCTQGDEGQCSCAAALTYACFLHHGCDVEDGCTPASGPGTTKQELISGCTSSVAQVRQFNGSCSAVCQ